MKYEIDEAGNVRCDQNREIKTELRIYPHSRLGRSIEEEEIDVEKQTFYYKKNWSGTQKHEISMEVNFNEVRSFSIELQCFGFEKCDVSNAHFTALKIE